MKISQIFENSKNQQELYELLSKLDPIFIIDNFMEASSDPKELYADLRVRPSAQFQRLPVKLGSVRGTVDLSGSNVTSFDNFPRYCQQLRLEHCQSLSSLNSNELVSAFLIDMHGLTGLKNLENSGTLKFKRISLNNCTGLVSFSGLEKIKPLINDHLLYVKIQECHNLADDPMRYLGLPFRFTFVQTPERLSIVHAIVSRHGTVEFRDLADLFDRYPILQEHYGKGATSILPLAKYFKSIKEPWRVTNTL